MLTEPATRLAPNVGCCNAIEPYRYIVCRAPSAHDQNPLASGAESPLAAAPGARRGRGLGPGLPRAPASGAWACARSRARGSARATRRRCLPEALIIMIMGLMLITDSIDPGEQARR